jgi:hypothetical protein
VLLARKFALACIAILIDRSPLMQVRSAFSRCRRDAGPVSDHRDAAFSLSVLPLQAALGVMVLFTSYIMQQRFSPFIILQDDLSKVVKQRRRRSALTTFSSEEDARRAARIIARGADPDPSALSSARRYVSARRAKPERRAQSVSATASKWIRHRVESVMADYNSLESGFLISAVLILISGMVFASGGFHPGSVPYNMLTTIVTVLILGSVLSFFVLLFVEVYKSFRDASLHDEQRKSEADRVEATLLQQSRYGSSRFHVRDQASVDMLRQSRLERIASLRSVRAPVEQPAASRALPVPAPVGGRPDVASAVLGMYANLPPPSRLPTLHRDGHGAGGAAAPAVRHGRAMKGRVAVTRQMPVRGGDTGAGGRVEVDITAAAQTPARAISESNGRGSAVIVSVEP